MFGFAGTVLCLPRQDYYQYQFVSGILPLGSWPLSSSYAACYFWRKPLSDLGGAGGDLPGVVIQAPDFATFHVWISRDFNVLSDFCTFAPCMSVLLQLYHVFHVLCST